VRHPRDGAVDTTALIDECLLKFAQRHGLAPADRTHFLGYSASVMRSSDAEIGEVPGVTDRTARRDWQKARLMLAHLLQDAGRARRRRWPSRCSRCLR
jgi:hypothetical protein